jgi:ADP-ribosylation factor-binding protein GGA
MEEEEREAQSAKLQELIRRGAPEDLQEANRLMKIMAGYDTRTKTDYRAKAAEDVGRIQAKARLLEERLEAFKPGDTMTEGDVFEELASALSSAQPKIQKMCEEESEDHEAVAKLLEINDSIHRTVERWKLLKKGDVEGAAKIAKGAPIPTLQMGGTASSSAANELSLIDFDGDANGAGSNAAGSSSQAGGVENDLLGLSLGEDSSSGFGQGGGISLGFGANSSMLSSSSHAEPLANSCRYPGTGIIIFNDPALYCQWWWTSIIISSPFLILCGFRLRPFDFPVKYSSAHVHVGIYAS